MTAPRREAARWLAETIYDLDRKRIDGDAVLASLLTLAGLDEPERGADEDTYIDDHGTTWTRPTAYGYAMACKALHRREEELEALAAQLAKVRAVLEEK